MNCPECSLAMVQEDHHGVTLDRCSSCEGLWFDLEEIHQYLKAHPETPVRNVPMDVDFRRTTSGLGDTCPCCRERAFEMGLFRGISFQRCTWCGGIFLTVPQLKQVIESHAGQVTVWGAGVSEPETDSSLRSRNVKAGVAVEAVGDGVVTELAGEALLAVLEFVVEAVFGVL